MGLVDALPIHIAEASDPYERIFLKCADQELSAQATANEADLSSVISSQDA